MHCPQIIDKACQVSGEGEGEGNEDVDADYDYDTLGRMKGRYRNFLQ